MAVLNIANQFKEEYLSRNIKELIFTKDKHIVTHGVDLLSDYASHTRGLVPDYKLEDSFGVLGHNGWAKITAEMLPILTDINGAVDNTTVPTSSAVKSYLRDFVSGEINAAQRMQFKGLIGLENGKIYHKPIDGNTNVGGMPKNASVGDTYLISDNNFTIAGYTVEAGDMVICKQAYVNQTTGVNTATYWFVIQRKLDLKTTTLTISGTEYSVYSPETKTAVIYAPSSAGTSGQLLVSNETNTPVWKTPGLSMTASGEISFSTGGQSTVTLKSLKAGVGLFYKDGNISTIYNGGVERELNLSPATATTLGGVIVGENITVDANGKIYLTHQDITGALGYTPAGPSGTVPQREIQIGGTALGNETALNFVTSPGGSVGIVASPNDQNTETSNVFDIGFDIFWFNLDTNQYEI